MSINTFKISFMCINITNIILYHFYSIMLNIIIHNIVIHWHINIQWHFSITFTSHVRLAITLACINRI